MKVIESESVKYKISGRKFYSPTTIFHQVRKIYVNDKPVYEEFIGSNTNSPNKSAVFYRILFLFKQRLRYDKLNARAGSTACTSVGECRKLQASTLACSERLQ